MLNAIDYPELMARGIGPIASNWGAAKGYNGHWPPGRRHSADCMREEDDQFPVVA
ncbi:hypothetical protein IVB55_39435 [Bradyrhizobium sp. CW4]|uniref:hypothetical protein n=1 Tax=Bradyrhizobium sp. CW4 TaxID=2782687 RepID=UPI001FF740F6|nr:hypothetical protein [Bradyrhizobium sp. CW4]MCK1418900.1 hypothetical protein [Bradyrhizobium sp. CW4]